LLSALGGPRQNADKLRHLGSLALALLRPRVVYERLARLRDLGHIEELATLSALLVAARDQMMVSASAETKLFYESQGIPWVFHNLRRFLSNPATMLDPVGLFSPRDVIIHHVLQTFHRHPLYDLVLLRAHVGGVEAIAEQAEQVVRGAHPHQRALESLVEDGGYHARLVRDIQAFAEAPHMAARPVPRNLLADPLLMLAMDQFKDLAGLMRYASRLQVRPIDALVAWLGVAFDETLGAVIGRRVGPQQVDVAACDPELVDRYLG
jgi:hypothetical protein